MITHGYAVTVTVTLDMTRPEKPEGIIAKFAIYMPEDQGRITEPIYDALVRISKATLERAKFTDQSHNEILN